MVYFQTPEQPRRPLLINILSILFLIASILLFNNPDLWLHLMQPVTQTPLFYQNYGDADRVLDTYGTDIRITVEAPVETNFILIETDVPIST